MHYARTFTTKNDYKLCTINVNIPFTGNDTPSARNKIVLTLDDEPLYDGQFHSTVFWDLRPLAIIAHKVDLKAGIHNIKVLGVAENGTLYAPPYNTDCMEHKMFPKLLGSMLITGIN